MNEKLAGIVTVFALCIVAASADKWNRDKDMLVNFGSDENMYTNLGLRTNLHGSSSGGSQPDNAVCLLKLYQVNDLQGRALQYWNSRLLARHKHGLAKVKRRFRVKSLETLGPCCWRICRSSKGRCKKGRIVAGKTQVHNLSEIKLRSVKRIKALKEKKCQKWSAKQSKKSV